MRRKGGVVRLLGRGTLPGSFALRVGHIRVQQVSHPVALLPLLHFAITHLYEGLRIIQ